MADNPSRQTNGIGNDEEHESFQLDKATEKRKDIKFNYILTSEIPLTNLKGKPVTTLKIASSAIITITIELRLTKKID